MTVLLAVSTQCTNVTDTQTPHDGIGRAYAYPGVAKQNPCSLSACKYVTVTATALNTLRN